MEKVSDYEILNAENESELTPLVKEKIKKGWQPLGAPYLSPQSDFLWENNCLSSSCKVQSKTLYGTKIMRKIIDYIIILSHDNSKFEEEIRCAISDGWQPYGSGYNPYASMGLAQPMVKYEEETPEQKKEYLQTRPPR